MEKGENAGHQHFLLFPQCFLTNEKKKRNHHFSYIKFVVCKCFQFGPVLILSFGKEFKPFPNKRRFSRICCRSLLKTMWEKKKLLVTEHFLVFLPCFLPVWRNSCHFDRIWNCRLQSLSVWKSPKSVVWKKVKDKLTSFEPLWVCRLQILWIWIGPAYISWQIFLLIVSFFFP